MKKSSIPVVDILNQLRDCAPGAVDILFSRDIILKDSEKAKLQEEDVPHIFVQDHQGNWSISTIGMINTVLDALGYGIICCELYGDGRDS